MEFGAGRAPGLGWSQGAGCSVCGSAGDCNHWPQITSAFTDWKGRAVPQPPKGHPIYADKRIFENERLVYAAGDIVPHDHAVRLGLIDPPTAPTEPAPEPDPQPETPEDKTAARAEARGRRQTADRQTIAPEDRSA